MLLVVLNVAFAKILEVVVITSLLEYKMLC